MLIVPPADNDPASALGASGGIVFFLGDRPFITSRRILTSPAPKPNTGIRWVSQSFQNANQKLLA